MAKKRKKNRRRATASEECGDDGRGAEGLTSCSDSSGAGTGRTVISQHARHPKQDAGDFSKEPSAALPNVQDCTNQGMRNGTTTSRKRRASEDNSTSDDVPNTSSTSTRTFSSVKPPPTLKKKRRKKHKRKAAPDDTGGLAASSIASATQTVKGKLRIGSTRCSYGRTDRSQMDCRMLLQCCLVKNRAKYVGAGASKQCLHCFAGRRV